MSRLESFLAADNDVLGVNGSDATEGKKNRTKGSIRNYALLISVLLAGLLIISGLLYLYFPVPFEIALAILLAYFCMLYLAWRHQSQVLEIRSLRASNAHLLMINQSQALEAGEALDNAKSANIAKSKFLAAASHDLRQPLHAMGLLLQVMEERLTDPSMIEMTQQIEHAHHSMEKLFSALLDVSKLDAGVVEVHRQDFSIREILEELSDEFIPLANTKGLAFSTNIDDVNVRSDPILLMRILRNLINNAIVHTNSGSVSVSTLVKPMAIDILVEDTGPGIPQQELSQVFSEFHQLNNPERDQSKGLGLGLAIVKRLCTLLGHDINVQSGLGEGAAFSLTVSRAADGATMSINQKPLMSVGAGNLRGAKILVIDDDRAILAAMLELLNRWGVDVSLALTPEEAMAHLAGDYLPDMAICDYRLREHVTGVDMLHMLNKSLGRRLPALLVTGDTAPERLREAHASGYVLLHKPVNPAKLRNAISQKLKGSYSAVDSA